MSIINHQLQLVICKPEKGHVQFIFINLQGGAVDILHQMKLMTIFYSSPTI